jgi:alpha-L-fucosidase
MKKLIIALLFAQISLAQNSTNKTGGGELNPGLYTNEKSIKHFQSLKLGISIHWGPNASEGEEISWSRGVETPQEKYDQLYKTFNPTKFDANQWAGVMDSFGAKYIVITTKHHDGFSMWHSNFSDYDIANTPFKRDVLKELSDACTKKNIVFGTYYSTLDWYHPDYQPYGHGGPGNLFLKDTSTPNINRYWIYVKNQLNELITKYNSKIIQFDGDWEPSLTHTVGSDLYLYIRKVNDAVIVNSRTDRARYNENGVKRKESWNAQIYAGDFEERERLTTNLNDGSEQGEMLGKSSFPWQAWVTLDKSQWSWKKNYKFIDSDELLIDMIKTIGDGGNYLINVGPKPDGTFEDAAIDVLKKSGVWVKAHAQAIYGTEGGPFVKEGEYTSTVKGKKIYLFTYAPISEIAINTNVKITSITDETNKPLKFSQTKDKLQFDISKNLVERNLKVYTLTRQ